MPNGNSAEERAATAVRLAFEERRETYAELNTLARSQYRDCYARA